MRSLKTLWIVHGNARGPGGDLQYRSGRGRGSSWRESYYERFLKGVSSANSVQGGNLGLQVLVAQSGGRVLNTGSDMADSIATLPGGRKRFYILTFDSPPADHPNEYHAFRSKSANPDSPAIRIRDIRSALAARGESTIGRVPSAAGADARRRDAGDTGISSRSANAADAPAPPEPFGRIGIAGNLCVARRQRCPRIASSSRLDPARNT